MINFGAGRLIAVPQYMADGTAVTNPTPVILGTMQDISVDLSVEMKTLYGSKRYPIAIGQGKGKTAIKAKYAEINGGILGQLFLGAAPAGTIKAAVFDFTTTIPATPFQVTIAPPSTGTFTTDLGVMNAATGVQLTRVASAPTTGQYSVNSGTGVYTFASADTGNSVQISYEYSATSTSAQLYNLTNQPMGNTPSFTLLLQNTYQGQTMVCKLNKAVSGQLNIPLKSDDFGVYDFQAEAFADSTGSLGYICLF